MVPHRMLHAQRFEGGMPRKNSCRIPKNSVISFGHVPLQTSQ